MLYIDGLVQECSNSSALVCVTILRCHICFRNQNTNILYAEAFVMFIDAIIFSAEEGICYV